MQIEQISQISGNPYNPLNQSNPEEKEWAVSRIISTRRLGEVRDDVGPAQQLPGWLIPTSLSSTSSYPDICNYFHNTVDKYQQEGGGRSAREAINESLVYSISLHHVSART